MSLQTPLARVRGLGSAKEGTHHWWAQRVTAIALVPLTAWFAISAVTLVGGDFAEVAAWVASPVNTILLLLLVAGTFHHLQLGLQVVIEDYVHEEAPKFALLLIMKFGCAIMAVACAYAILKTAFGG